MTLCKQFYKNSYLTGNGSLQNLWTPVSTLADSLVSELTVNKHIWTHVTIGSEHCFLCANDNTTWGVGYGGSGQLGFPILTIANAQSEDNHYENDSDLPFTYDFQDLKGTYKNTDGFNPVLKVPLEWILSPDKQIIKVSCGKYHTVYLAKSNKVFSTGLFTHEIGRASCRERVSSPV